MPNEQKQYKVTIRAIVTKTLIVEAENAEEANDIAHERFTTGCDGMDEDYDQDTIGTISEVMNE